MRFSPILVLLGALVPHESFASEELAQKVADFYRGTECAAKTAAYTGDSPEAARASLREILRIGRKQSDEESIYMLLETVSGTKFNLEMSCLPALKTIAPHDRWIALLREKKIASMGGEGSAANKLITALGAELAREADPKAVELKKELTDVLEPMYAEFRLRQQIVRLLRVFGDPDGEARALLVASRLGDARAYEAAKSAVNSYLAGIYDDHEGYHQAVIALAEFSTNDPAVISSRSALLKKVVDGKITPEITRQALSEIMPAN